MGEGGAKVPFIIKSCQLRIGIFDECSVCYSFYFQFTTFLNKSSDIKIVILKNNG